MEVKEAIRVRKCYRGMYLDKPVPREALREILEAALAAPSGCNRQTVSAIAVDDPETLSALGKALGFRHFASAPAAVCILSEAKIAYGDVSFFKQDYGAAVENAFLTITSLGMETCWVEGDITGEPEIQAQFEKILDLPENLRMVCFLPVGYPAEEGKRREKMPFESRAFFNRYGNHE